MPIKITVVYTGLFGMPAVNSFFFNGTDQAAATAAQSAVTAYMNGIKPYISSLVTMKSDSVAISLNEASGVIGQYLTTTGATVQGTDTGQPLPPGTSMVVSLGTDNVRGGRRVQGRFFVPGLTEGAPDPLTGLLSNASVNTLSGVIRTALGGTNPLFGVYSRPVYPPGPPAPAIKAGLFSPQANIQVKSVLSSLRSRRR